MAAIRLPKARAIAVLTSALFVVGCSSGEGPGGDSEVPVGDPAAAPNSGDVPLVPAEAGFDQVNALVKDPARDPLPEDSLLAAQIGADGQGVDLQDVKPGPLWGPGSWNDGAGAARVYPLAGYIRYAMPLTLPGILSDKEAQHLGAYINAQERPIYEGKAEDYPLERRWTPCTTRAVRRIPCAPSSWRRVRQPPGKVPLGSGPGNLGVERGLYPRSQSARRDRFGLAARRRELDIWWDARDRSSDQSADRPGAAPFGAAPAARCCPGGGVRTHARPCAGGAAAGEYAGGCS